MRITQILALFKKKRNQINVCKEQQLPRTRGKLLRESPHGGENVTSRMGLSQIFMVTWCRVCTNTHNDCLATPPANPGSGRANKKTRAVLSSYSCNENISSRNSKTCVGLMGMRWSRTSCPCFHDTNTSLALSAWIWQVSFALQRASCPQ